MAGQRSSYLPQGAIDALRQARVIYLATLRKDGRQSKAAPLWFTITSEQRILIQSGSGAWRVRRIRGGSPVIVWIGNKRGFAFVGRAEVSDDPTIAGQIVNDFPQKYLMAWLGLYRPTESSFKRGERVAITITPIQILPPGFRSRPGVPGPCIADV